VEKWKSRWKKKLMRVAPGVMLSLAGIAATMFGSAPGQPVPPDRAPLVIAHRGASGYRPEHTLEAYALAIQQGADFIEPDLVSTRDGVLVARHENEISSTTDVSSHTEFASRFKTKTIDGRSVSGWFTEDFTLAELKTLRARERLPQLRSTSFDGRFQIPAFEEVLALVAKANERRHGSAKPVGIYPETKHPTYFRSIGLPLEDALVTLLHSNGYRDPDARVFIQSFEVGNLKTLATMTRVPLVQLLDSDGKPYDFVASGNPRTYIDMTRPADLAEIARYARGIGVHKSLVLPIGPSNEMLTATTVVKDAHRAGLIVHAWTFRAENAFLPSEFRIGAAAGGTGDLRAEMHRFAALGIDGYFTDQPDIGVAARDAFMGRR
jgi:glycerophosphoryl diester phosphodiesterase